MKNKSIKVSIIVPVYNVEKYLEKCLVSLTNQTYSNIEIILVDDGSTDNSSSICDLYKKYSSVKVYHKKNGGLSDARNFGIKKATGDYYSFIDSDDYVDTDFIEKLLNEAIRSKSDIVSSSKILEYPKKNFYVNDCKKITMDYKEALFRLFKKDEFDNSTCDKLYKSTLFNDIKFPVGRYYEDMYTIYKVVMKSKIVSHITGVYYHYRINSNSISNEKFSIKQLDCVYASKEAYENVKNINNSIKESAYSYYILQISNCIQKMHNSKNKKEYKKEYKDLKKTLSANRMNYIRNSCISFKKKIMLLFVDLGLLSLVSFIKNIIYRKEK